MASWPKTTAFRSRSRFQAAAVIRRHVGRRDARNLGDDLLDVRFCRSSFLLRLGRMRCAHRLASMITSMALSGRCRSLMTDRQLDSRGQLPRRILDPVVRLEAWFQALRISTVSAIEGSATSIFWKRRDSAWSFLEDAAILVVGGCPDALQLARRQRRLEQVRRVERPPTRRRRRSGCGSLSMKRIAFGLSPSCFSTPLRRCSKSPRYICRRAANPCRARTLVCARISGIALDDTPRQTFGNRRLADTGFANQQRVVLAATAERLDDPLEARDRARSAGRSLLASAIN